MRPLDDEINVLKLKLEAMGPLDGLSEEEKLSYSAYRVRDLVFLSSIRNQGTAVQLEQQGRGAGAFSNLIRKTCRVARDAIEPIRIGLQPQDGPDARPRHSPVLRNSCVYAISA